jgi:hypothetical protein
MHHQVSLPKILPTECVYVFLFLGGRVNSKYGIISLRVLRRLVFLWWRVTVGPGAGLKILEKRTVFFPHLEV